MFVTLTDPYTMTDKIQKKGGFILSAALPETLTRKNILKELVRQNLIP